jgi:hypothetical protein
LSSSPLEDGADPLRIDPPADHRWSEEPFDLVRLAVGSVALLGTILAVVLAMVTHDARMLQLVGALWAVYGLTVGFLSGVLEPVLDGLFQLLVSGGLTRVGTGYSRIETLAAQGHHEAAAEAYAERARNPAERVEATLRRSRLLTGPLSEPESAAVELDSLRAHPLLTRDDVRVGLALVELYENRLDNPGRAMAELRRLIDRHPAGQGARQLRATLRELKSRRYPDVPSS